VESQIAIPAIMQEGYILPVFEVTPGNLSRISIPNLLKIIYFAGVAILLALLLIKIIRVILLIARSEKIKMEDYYLIKSSGTESPFSFLNYIVIPDNQYNESELASIVMHERNHIRQFHSIDLIVSEIFKALQWFNPVSWLYNRELQYIHEYTADKSVMKNGINREEYLSLLIFNTNENHSNSIYNNFNILLIKKRIKMIMDTSKKSRAWLKIMPAIALTICLLAAHTGFSQSSVQFNGKDGILFIVDGKAIDNLESIDAAQIESVDVYRDKNIQQFVDKYGNRAKDGVMVITTKKSKNPSEVVVIGYGVAGDDEANVEKVFDVVDQSPEFPDGNVLKFVAENIFYPVKAQENKMEGKVTVKFVIKSDGSIDNVRILRGVSESLDNEAIRIVKAMPKWIPGRQNGKAVNVYFTLPIDFKLQK
jgi:TonB family protein